MWKPDTNRWAHAANRGPLGGFSQRECVRPGNLLPTSGTSTPLVPPSSSFFLHKTNTHRPDFYHLRLVFLFLDLMEGELSEHCTNGSQSVLRRVIHDVDMKFVCVHQHAVRTHWVTVFSTCWYVLLMGIGWSVFFHVVW